MLIVEKASTCAQAIFGSINACLRELKECATIIVG
jgi:hypothetical protein